jgi:hypothetical protein
MNVDLIVFKVAASTRFPLQCSAIFPKEVDFLNDGVGDTINICIPDFSFLCIKEDGSIWIDSEGGKSQNTIMRLIRDGDELVNEQNANPVLTYIGVL